MRIALAREGALGAAEDRSQERPGVFDQDRFRRAAGGAACGALASRTEHARVDQPDQPGDQCGKNQEERKIEDQAAPLGTGRSIG